jgi:hypothetical protein
MAVADKIYSFRAPSEFSERLKKARASFNAATHDTELSAHLGNEFELALIRRLRTLAPDTTDGMLVRAIVEAFVAATDRVHREEELMAEFEAFDRDDVEGDAWRRAALRLTGERIAAEEN